MNRRWDCAVLFFLAATVAVPGGRAQQQSTSSSNSSSSSTTHGRRAAAVARPDAGSVINGVYKNQSFGFTCKIPAGWVLRTEEMNARESDDGKSAADKSATVPGKAGRVLLTAFSRPPEARGEDVNSSVLIAAESAEAYPGLKEAAQYFGPVTEVAQAQGFEVINEPYEFAVGTKTVVRSDFQRDVGTRMMWQSTLVIFEHGYVVSFTFLGGNEDEVEDLVQGLSFGAGRTPGR
ncbi:MAG: hypothetical protein WB762_07950 [Candidatus Sulfotelmatobacter sp.]